MERKKQIIFEDLCQIYENTKSLWPQLNGMRLFMTGGTGLIGSWMINALCFGIDQLELDIEITLLTRSIKNFSKMNPILANKSYVKLLEGNILSIDIPEGHFTHIIHAATDASADLNDHDPLLMFDTIFLGTRWVLEFAKRKSIKRILNLSSGAIYGSQPWELIQISEGWQGGPDISQAKSAYAEGKRASEQLCSIYAKQFGIEAVTARIFAVVGPGLPLDKHFAIGNFIRDALNQKPITIQGDGRPCRSYIYLSDLTTWLWIIFIKAQAPDQFNVGSNHGLSMIELANLINELLNGAGVSILGKIDQGWNQGRYIPSVEKIKTQLGVSERVTIIEAIQRTAEYYRNQ